MLIREFTLEDYDCVRQLWEEQGIALDASDTLEGVGRKLQCAPDLFLVAENTGVLLGVIVGSWDGETGWISHHAVDRPARRMGIGTKLVEEVERRLKAKGAQQVALLVPRDNVEAQEFYKDSGFAVTEDQIVMKKGL